MKWINFLHIYQLANADNYIIEEATEKSYKLIVKILKENPNWKITLNITGCLILRWQDIGYHDLIEDISRLAKKGQIELVGSASNHALLPLTPHKEVKEQIAEDIDILKNTFGKNLKLRGFFLPEMAYSKEVAKIVKEKGFEWIILDEISYNGKLNEVDLDRVYIDKKSRLKVIFRSRKYSSCFFPSYFSENKDIKNLVITATDGELYGLRHQDLWGHLGEMLKRDDVITQTISEFIDESKVNQKADIIDSNWESTEEEIANNEPYCLWYNKGNIIQEKIWELANLSYKTVDKFRKDKNYNWARWHLVRGMASCTFWWASERDFTAVFGPYAWNPDQIERGINELIRAIRSLDDAITRQTKIDAEKLYLNIKRLVWEKHWTYYWKKDD